VTGGSSGIGRAAALAFARAGAKVVIAARGVERGKEVERELTSQGADARFIPADLSIAGEVERLVASTVQAYGRLDAGSTTPPPWMAPSR
jgi:NAD(P)-dependent dehydrogenase (short-subunit alcohol dehydrogenase family)